MSLTDTLKRRLDINNDSDNYLHYTKHSSLDNMQKRLNAFGGTDQWTRMRQDKLRGLKKALLYSYQAAVVQKYDVTKESLATNLIAIITILQDKGELSDNQLNILKEVESQYHFDTTDKDSSLYINNLQNIVDSLTTAEPYFRCLINHDKLKVAYEDKIISIPFFEPPIGEVDPQETNFHNGTVFKWIHGNKEEWTPDTYWIVYMQYSEETAYFRAEIRKADEEIEIVTVDEEGNENPVTYRGWMTGPNETTTLWNVKKGVVWNDMNYTKLLYITKDENTSAFFERFDRVIINGQPWEVQAYNESYSTSKNAGTDTGIIRVALKETYTNASEFVKNELAAAQAETSQPQVNPDQTNRRISGPTSVRPFDVCTYTAVGFGDDVSTLHWTLSNSSLARFIEASDDNKTVTIEIITGKSNSEGFDINLGESEDTKIHVSIGSL